MRIYYYIMVLVIFSIRYRTVVLCSFSYSSLSMPCVDRSAPRPVDEERGCRGEHITWGLSLKHKTLYYIIDLYKSHMVTFQSNYGIHFVIIDRCLIIFITDM